ncbi:MAG: hypothetical protein QM765_18475 [Myxococcales bacterium]
MEAASPELRERSERARRVDDLRALLRRADDAYYLLDQPLMPDADYDARMRELRALEEQYPEALVPGQPDPARRYTALGSLRSGASRGADAVP